MGVVVHEAAQGLNPGDISQIKVNINIQTTFNSEHQNSEA